MTTQLVRRITAVALLAAFILPGGSWHASRAEDDVCLTVEAPHDASNHRIDDAPSAPRHGAEHCAICHWWQSLRLAHASARTMAVVDTTSVHVAQPQALVSLIHTSTLRGRAPPALD